MPFSTHARSFVAASPSLWYDGGAIFDKEKNFAAAVRGGTAAPRVLITNGASPARVLHTKAAGGIYSLPALKEKKNPIGAGDTVTAMLADGLLRGLNEEEAVRRALAHGMASCATPLPADFSPVDAAAYEAHITREAL